MINDNKYNVLITESEKLLKDVVVVEGDSMIGVGLFDGMFVKYSTYKKYKTGDIVIVEIDGKIFIKEYFFLNGKIVFKSKNNKYPDIEDYRDYKIIGKMEYFFSK